MRLHLSLAVPDLDSAIRYYSTLFDHEPTFVQDHYAKWLLDDPKVNFVVESRGRTTGVDHLGIQAETDDELPVVVNRMKAAGGDFVDVGPVQCCYARLDKAWTRGMAGEKWEGFLTHDQGEQQYGEDTDHLLDRPGAGGTG